MLFKNFFQEILEMMEHIDDDDYFQKQLEAKSSALKRKPEQSLSSPTAAEDSTTKKQRSVDDYCDDLDLNRLIGQKHKQTNG